MLQKMELSYIFSKESFSYISGNKNLQKKKRTFLYLEKGIFRTRSIFRTLVYLESETYSELSNIYDGTFLWRKKPSRISSSFWIIFSLLTWSKTRTGDFDFELLDLLGSSPKFKSLVLILNHTFVCLHHQKYDPK